VSRDDLYKSGTIYTGPGEPPNSQSRPTPRPKQVAGKPITKGKLLRPGGPGGGPSKLASRPATSRPVPQALPQAVPQAAPAASLPRQPRPVPQVHPSTQRAVPQPLAAINGISHGRSESASSTERSLPPPPHPAAPPAARKSTYRALYDFIGQNPNELSIRKNDVVEAMQKEGNGKLPIQFPRLRPNPLHYHHPLTDILPVQKAGGSPRNKTVPPKAGPHPRTSRKSSQHPSTHPQSATFPLLLLLRPAPTASPPPAPSPGPPRNQNRRLPPHRPRDRRRRRRRQEAKDRYRRRRRGTVPSAWARRTGVRRVAVAVGGIRRGVRAMSVWRVGWRRR